MAIVSLLRFWVVALNREAAILQCSMGNLYIVISFKDLNKDAGS
ncbi:hypothetical protein [Oculatella sp. LEGE 06141]|nr:hypothetical protein [Oculatella sp. LEGE 06141]